MMPVVIGYPNADPVTKLSTAKGFEAGVVMVEAKPKGYALIPTKPFVKALLLAGVKQANPGMSCDTGRRCWPLGRQV